MTFIMRGPHPLNYISTRGCLGLRPSSRSFDYIKDLIVEGLDWSGTTGTPSRVRRRGGLMEDFITAADLGLKDPPVFERPPCIHGGGQRVFKDRRVVYSQSPLDQTQVLGIDVLD